MRYDAQNGAIVRLARFLSGATGHLRDVGVLAPAGQVARDQAGPKRNPAARP
jgi:hypothetical protein